MQRTIQSSHVHCEKCRSHEPHTETRRKEMTVMKFSYLTTTTCNCQLIVNCENENYYK